MKKAIVTGANGFVGEHVVSELIKSGYSVVAIAHSKPVEIIEGVEYIIADLNKTPKFNELSRSDVLFHFAWEGSSGDKRSNVAVQMNNVVWTNNMVKLSKRLGAKFVGAGSIMENETFVAHQYNNCLPDNNSIYAAAKYFAHISSKKEAYTLNVEHVWGVITNAYGPGEKNPRLINTTIKKIIEGKTLNFTSGEQLYDFIYIEDLAKAFRLLGEKGKSQHQYVLGSGKPKPLKNYLEEMRVAVGYHNPFNYGAIPFSGISLDQKDYDSTNTHIDLDYVPETPFTTGIEKTYRWYCDHYEPNGN